jgi:hypothetical protein
LEVRHVTTDVGEEQMQLIRQQARRLAISAKKSKIGRQVRQAAELSVVVGGNGAVVC